MSLKYIISILIFLFGMTGSLFAGHGSGGPGGGGCRGGGCGPGPGGPPGGGSKYVVIDDDMVECPAANFYSFTDAIAWLGSNGNDNYTIEACPGSYVEGNLFNGTWSWKYDSGLSIYSSTNNPADVTIDNDGSSTIFNLMGGMTNLTIRGMTLECGAGCSDAALKLSSSYSGVIIDNMVINSNARGVYVQTINSNGSFATNEITDLNITAAGNGIYFGSNGGTLTLDNNKIQSAGTYGIYMDGNVLATVTNNEINNTNAGGIAIVTPSNWNDFNIYSNCFTASTDINNRLQDTANTNFDVGGVGNYWSNYTTCADVTGDGICDSPYLVPGAKIEYDYNPWVQCGGGGGGGSSLPTTKQIIIDDDGVECSDSHFTSLTDAFTWILADTTFTYDNWEIKVCPGTYNEGNLVQDHYKYDQNLTIYGSTGNAADVIFNNNGESNIFYVKDSHIDFNLSNVTLNCNDGSCTNGAIYTDGAHNGLILDNIIINSESYGVNFASSSITGLKVSNIDISGTLSESGIKRVSTGAGGGTFENITVGNAQKYGMYFSGSGTYTLNGASLSAVRDAIYYTGGNALNVSNASLTSTTMKGINLFTGSNGSFTATDVNVTADDTAIWVDQVSGGTLTNIIMSSATDNGFYHKNANGNVVTMTNVTVMNAARDGITITNTRQPVFNGITVNSAGWRGFRLAQGGTNTATFTDIDIVAGDSGITLDSSFKAPTFNVSALAMNKIVAADDGISMQYAGNFQLLDTNITAGGVGVKLVSAGHGFNIKRNIINSSGTHGIWFFSGYANGEISSNVIGNDNATGKGLQTLNTWDYVDIYNNCFYANTNIDDRLDRSSPGVNFDIGGTGNYWSDVSDTGGYSNVCADTDMNGVCDTRYGPIPTQNIHYDNYPLTSCALAFGGGGGGGGGGTVYTFDAWESAKSISDRKVYTKILNASSNSVTIASLNETGSALENYDGVVKARAVNSATCPLGDDNLSTWTTVDMTGISTATPTITYGLLSQDARIQIEDKEGNRSCSSDNFAIRPDRFDIAVRKTDGTLLNNAAATGVPVQVAGDGFNITARALDAGSNPAAGFNEAFIVSASLNGAGILGTLGNSAQTFLNGERVFDSNYSEAGVIDINISSDAAYASVDSADGSDYIISGAGQTTGRFIPDRFDVTATLLSMTSPAKAVNPTDCNYTYLSEDMDYNVTVAFEVNVTALNSAGDVTVNYDSAAYAKDATLGMTFEHNASGSIASVNIADNIASTEFTSGVANLNESATFNISAPNSRKTPQNPIIFDSGDVTRFTVMDVNDSDNVNESVTLPYVISGVSSEGIYIVYGRINPIDATSAANGNANVRVYYEVYGSNRNTVAKAFNVNAADLNESVNDVNWWRNPRHQLCDNFDAGDFALNSSAARVGVTPNADRDNVLFSYGGARPAKVRVDFNMNSSFNFLYYHPYSNNFITSFYINFVPTQPAGGDSDIIENEGSETKGSSRIGE